MDRRLPVYLLIDCSHSMRGDPIAMVNRSIQQMVADLCANPQALETVWLSVITFATGAKQIVPLTEILQFTVPELTAKGQTDLGAGLRLLAKKMDREVRQSSPEQKGDWKPIAFLLTDGGPGDAWIKPANEIRARHDAGQLIMIAVGFGDRIHEGKLKRITPQVLLSQSSSPESFAKFMAWVSSSIGRSCQVGGPDDFLSKLPPPPQFIICPP